MSSEKEEVEFFDTSSNDGDSSTPQNKEPEEIEEIEEIENIEDPGPVAEKKKLEAVPEQLSSISMQPGRILPGRVGGAGSSSLSQAQKEALEELKQEEEAKQAATKRKQIRETSRRQASESPSKSKPNFIVSILKWLYGLVACCNPLLPPLRKRTSRSSTRERELPKLSELREVDGHLLDIYSEVDDMVKEHYVRASGGGDYDTLKFTPVGYKLLRSGGFHYFMKLKVNKGPEYVHVQIFKAGRAQAIVIGDLDLDKTEADEIRQI